MDFLALYDEIKRKTTEKIVTDHGLEADEAEILLPAMCIIANMLAETKADRIIIPEIALSDSIIYEKHFPDEFKKLDKAYEKNTMMSVRAHAERFDVPAAHYTQAEKFALKIFDKLKEVHGLGARERLLLQAASVLHDVGKYVNIRKYRDHTYNIVSGLEITGLNYMETELVAQIAQSKPSNLVTAKLSAILHLANALDKSKKQKFKSIETSIEANEFIVTAICDENTELEEWEFYEMGVFFTEVFGMKAEFRKRRKTVM
jgi:exopolyphosphatase/guanosine-5'-triphosphate,3'-diphosphate pyrophosphatase